MSERWNIEPTDDPKQFFLLNGSRTSLVLSKRSRFDVVLLLSEMEERGVPLRYTDALEEIKLTVHRDAGTYLRNRIKLHSTGWGVSFWMSVCKTFVHELGHHLDELEAISDDPMVIKEQRARARFMPEPSFCKDVPEYVAMGFEAFYFGNEGVVKRMRKKNGRLFARITQVHKKYRS